MDKVKLRLGAYDWTIFRPDGQCEGAIYIPMHGDAEEVISLLPDTRAALISISGFDWNKDLSPWPARAVFGGEDFAGGADAFLDELTHLIPAVESEAGIQPAWRGVAGYSLAGLLAVYAAYRTNLFTRVASVSGSMWYDGWMEYAERTPFAADLTHAYFSVGAKEKKTRNVRMASVEENTRTMNELFLSRGVESTFTLNPGNHFVDAGKRMADAAEFISR